MQTVTVIGSNSFSGADFVDLLLKETDHHVLAVSRSPQKSPLFLPYLEASDLSRLDFHQLDVNRDADRLLELLSERQPAYIVNFAAQSEVAPSWDAPEQWFQTNAVAVARLGNFLKDQAWLKRYVHISTPEVYGTCQGVIDETAPLNPSTPYAASKAAGDLMLSTLVKNFDFPLVTIRATNVYGPHQQLHKIIPRSVIYLKSGRTIELHAGGRHVRSFIHIRDVSRGELAAMQQGTPGEVYHLSPDQSATIRQIVQTICDMMERDFAACTRDVDDRVGQDNVYTIDSSKARAQFSWKPRITLEEGLASVIAWVQRHWESIQHEPWKYVHKP
jgi:dTDP-glucose 4,6-dehydratase